jgi:hypothetical protein
MSAREVSTVDSASSDQGWPRVKKAHLRGLLEKGFGER